MSRLKTTMLRRSTVDGIQRKVIDAREDLVIEVIDDDILGAIPGAPGKCALARACTRIGYIAEFFLSVAYLRRDPNALTETRYGLRREASEKIFTIDDHGAIPPGRYLLFAHTALHPSISPKKGARGPSGRTGPRKQPRHAAFSARPLARLKRQPK